MMRATELAFSNAYFLGKSGVFWAFFTHFSPIPHAFAVFRRISLFDGLVTVL